MERQTFVHMDYPDRPVLVGRLWSHVRKGRETATFEYDATWLARADRYALEPALLLAPGPYHTGADRPMFGALGDSAPDRWGRTLMRRAERMAAARARRAARSLSEIDILLLVDDEARAGALRFSNEIGGPFLAPPEKFRIPPIVELPRLLSATEHLIDDAADDDDSLQLLIAPGSSLGGARPKASVRDRDGTLAIAKFPRKDDAIRAVQWEAVAFALAKRAGIDVPQWRIERAAAKPVLISRRFDRENGRRIPFLSAMSMLGAIDNEDHSYSEIAEAIRRYGAAPKDDLQQLWRRMVFNVLISNTDDHLRNHGFLYEGPRGWRLSPAYDLNPVPADIKARVLSTAIVPDDPTASMTLAFEAAAYCGLKPEQARGIAAEIAEAVSMWRNEAERAEISPAETERMASAFQHEDAKIARGKRP